MLTIYYSYEYYLAGLILINELYKFPNNFILLSTLILNKWLIKNPLQCTFLGIERLTTLQWKLQKNHPIQSA